MPHTTPYQIIIVGAGNVAWHLAKQLEEASFVIEAIVSRNIQSAEALAARLYNAVATTSLNLSSYEADTVLLCVNDDAIQTVADQLIVSDDVVVAHTSGSRPLSVLQRFKHAGVLYPCQTFSKDKKLDLSDIPFCLEATDKATMITLTDMASGLSHHLYEVSSEERAKLHLAAVFASNFTNHILAASQDILNNYDIPADMLEPLVKETIAKAFEKGAFVSQTGPAIRNDQTTMQKHLLALEELPKWRKLYQAISHSIVESYHGK